MLASRSRPSQIGRILASGDLRPHKVDGWLTRRDTPEFWERAADICGLYLSPPENAVVLSIDEKTSMQAKERKHPATPVAAGTAISAGVRVLPPRHRVSRRLPGRRNGQGHRKDIVRNDSVTFISFLEEIDESIEEGLEIHVVLDNGSSHTSKATKAWLAEHPRFVVHHTPAHASWLNQVECFFSILTPQVAAQRRVLLTRGPRREMLAFIEHHSETAKPFKWVYDARSPRDPRSTDFCARPLVSSLRTQFVERFRESGGVALGSLDVVTLGYEQRVVA